MWSKGRSASGAAPAGRQGPGRPLAGTERAFFAVSRRSPLNLVVLVRLSGPALDRLLPQALAIMQRRHPLLRARITGRSSRPRFEVRAADLPAGTPGPVPLRVLHGAHPESAFDLVN